MPNPEPPPTVEIRTSDKRRKTATAQWRDGKIVVQLPSHIRGKKRAELVEWLVTRATVNRPDSRISDNDLMRRSAELADLFVDSVRPTSIRWVTNQNKRWASCSIESGDIRISHRLKDVPQWVLDSVIVHELAHLIEENHSQRFRQIAARYPKTAEATIFLEGYGLGLNSDIKRSQ
ncbi:MAG TPA: M48 family metallopeptidase [Acidimicrobiales bacterium]|nr:M48 family metallopeptidase [Acidimicrobiales bacterium]